MKRLTKKVEWDSNASKYVSVYKTNNKKGYSPAAVLEKSYVKDTFDFAYSMSYGAEGQHRRYRTGGKKNRENNQIFSDAFQGKLAEYAIYNTFINNNITLEKPDMDIYGLGIWDNSDFKYNYKKISVKSTKFYGQLMLLESQDWNEEGLYIPNLGTENECYDYFILVRIYPFADEIMKKNRIYYSSNIRREQLEQILLSKKFTYDIPGYMTRSGLEWIIQNGYVIKQGNYINRFADNNKLDANNYYIQAGDLHSTYKLIEELKK